MSEPLLWVGMTASSIFDMPNAELVLCVRLQHLMLFITMGSLTCMQGESSLFSCCTHKPVQDLRHVLHTHAGLLFQQNIGATMTKTAIMYVSNDQEKLFKRLMCSAQLLSASSPAINVTDQDNKDMCLLIRWTCTRPG